MNVNVLCSFNEAAGIPRGKHDRPDTASPAHPGASMRPRVFPAENTANGGHGTIRDTASMRPRVFPAENRSASVAHRCVQSCFNEAAGIPRGKLIGSLQTYGPVLKLQ